LARTPDPRSAPTPAPTYAVRPPPPIVGEVDRLIAEGRAAEALILGYLTAEADVQQAFGIRVPRQCTHREFLKSHLRDDMGYVAVLLPRLYALYEPVRFGPSRPVPGALVRDLVHAIYDEGPIFNLYRDPNYAARFNRPGIPGASTGSAKGPTEPAQPR